MKKKLIKLTEDEFYERFNPIKNHFYANPEDCSFDGCMFETYGKEVDYIKELIADGGKASVWTILEVDGKMYFASGWHYVNRFGYIVTNEPVPEGEEYEVCLDTEPDSQMHTAKFVKVVTVTDPDTKGLVELSIYKHQGGGMFAIDSSFLDQVVNTDDFDRAIIPDPFSDNGVEEGTISHVVLFE
jgi:hypothetical protein